MMELPLWIGPARSSGSGFAARLNGRPSSGLALFSASRRTFAATFRARIEHLLRFRARSVHVLVPPSPSELGSLLPVLFEPAMTAKGLVWVEAIRADPLRSCADQPGPWTAAWDQLLLLLNERRDALSRHLQGGLMMVAPVAVKPRARVAAADVWSIRSVVIEVPARGERSAADSGDEIEATEGLRSPAGEPVSPARMQFREIDAFLARGETVQATALARKAVATQRARSVRLCAEALEWLCRSRDADGDIAAALEHVGEAIQLRRSLVRSAGELSPLLRELASSLALAGKLRQDTGDLEGSDAAFQESLTICRKLLQVDGETPQTLRDTEARLCSVAEVQHARGDLAGAAAAYGEAVDAVSQTDGTGGRGATGATRPRGRAGRPWAGDPANR